MNEWKSPEYWKSLNCIIMIRAGHENAATTAEESDRRPKLCLNEDLYYQSYKRCNGQLLTEKAKENYLSVAKKLLNKVKRPVEPRTTGSSQMQRILVRTTCTTPRKTDGLLRIHMTLLMG